MPRRLQVIDVADRMKVHILARLAGLGLEELIAVILRARQGAELGRTLSAPTMQRSRAKAKRSRRWSAPHEREAS